MSQRLTNRSLLSMMDSKEFDGLRQYLRNGRLRDGGGHGGGATDDDSDPTPPVDDPEEDDEDDEDDEDEDPKPKKKSKSKKDEDDDEDDEATVPAFKYEKLEKRMKAADRRASAAEAEVKDLKAKLAEGKDVSPELKQELSDHKSKADKLSTTNRNLVLQNAFLTTPIKGITWRDPEAALKLVDLSDVDIDEETGQVDKRSLRAALRDLAKRKKYLVATPDDAGDDDEDEDDEEDVRPVRKKSGSSMNGKRKGDRGQSSKAELAKRFPILGRM